MDPLATVSGAELMSVTHVIQTALTPVFLLSGIGSLLNVFNLRLGRVSDHASYLTDMLADAEDTRVVSWLTRHLRRLSHRRLALDAAVVFGALAGACTCAAAFALFVVTLRDAAGATVLLWLFGGALACTISALICFLVDTVLAWHGVRMEGPIPRPKPAPAPPVTAS
jgi:hypothetical protein